MLPKREKVPYLSKSPKMINIEIFFLRNRIRNSDFMDPSWRPIIDGSSGSDSQHCLKQFLLLTLVPVIHCNRIGLGGYVPIFCIPVYISDIRMQ
jgi:hypothetical protein